MTAIALTPQIVGKYEMGRVLASGDFDCRTRICTHVVTGAQYAVRIYDKSILAEASWMWNQTREAVQVMRTLPKHENIVEMVECFETATSLYILMQLHAPMQITKLYTTQRDIPLSRTKHLFTQVVRGLMHMHDNNVAHCGVAPDHMLVNDRDQVKIGFLVSCRFFQKGKPLTEMRGTKHTVAPEVLRQEPYNPVLADSWSLGVLLFFMLNGGQYPHDGANTTKNILNNKTRPLNPALPPLARDLVAQLLAYNPSQRLSVGDVFHHPWMLEDRLDEDVEFVQRNANARNSLMSVVESSYDAGSEVLSITIPFGLSQQEEAAYIIQHTWKAYQRRKVLAGASMLNRQASRGGTLLRLKRITSTIRHLPTGRRRSQHDGAAAAVDGSNKEVDRRISRGSFASMHALSSPRAAAAAAAATQHNSASMRLRGAAAAGSGAAASFNPHQCNHCGRLPPQRIHPGKSPYPSAKFKLTSDGEFVATEPTTTAEEYSV